ncbi:MAG TPA: SDR family oxidoreductase [Sphingomonadaceae bacterium]|nr:SDR family oxidoreductase [Sphingomonadaceae bacterium]
MAENTRKVAVVSGGAGGLGAAIAERLAQDGHAVAIVDIKEDEAVAGRIAAAGGEAAFFRCDITDPAAVEALARDVEARLGPCDILVNNAGRYEHRAFEDLTFEHWRAVMALNVDGMFLMAKAFAPAMRRRRWGRIVNMTSNSVFLAPPHMPQYVTSKAAIIGLTRALGAELGADGVTVNAVAPGPVGTEKVRASYAEEMGGGSEDGFDDFMGALAANQSIKRPGTPRDVAALVAFLAREEAEMITTQTIVVDGGWARV